MADLAFGIFMAPIVIAPFIGLVVLIKVIVRNWHRIGKFHDDDD